MFSRICRSMRASPRDARPSGAPLPAEDVQAGLRRLESITARSQQDSKGRYEHPPEHFPSFIDHGFSGFRKWRRTVEPIPTLSPEELEQSYATAGSNPGPAGSRQQAGSQAGLVLLLTRLRLTLDSPRAVRRVGGLAQVTLVPPLPLPLPLPLPRTRALPLPLPLTLTLPLPLPR